MSTPLADHRYRPLLTMRRRLARPAVNATASTLVDVAGASALAAVGIWLAMTGRMPHTPRAALAVAIVAAVVAVVALAVGMLGSVEQTHASEIQRWQLAVTPERCHNRLCHRWIRSGDPVALYGTARLCGGCVEH